MSTTTPNLGLFKYDPSTDVAQTFNIQQALNNNWDKLDSSILLDLAAAAPYSTSQTYALGAYCTRGGKLYKCTTAITSAETWTAAHWTETTMGAELVAISIALAKKADLDESGKVLESQLPDMNFAPSTHASQHASDGVDPITPAEIGAAPAYTYGTTDLTAGTSPLETGKLYFVYE